MKKILKKIGEGIELLFIAIFGPIEVIGSILLTLPDKQEYEHIKQVEKELLRAEKEAERRQRQMQRQAEREALRQEREAQRAASKPAPEILSQEAEEAICALRSLGFTQKSANERIKTIFRDSPSASAEDAVKLALKR